MCVVVLMTVSGVVVLPAMLWDIEQPGIARCTNLKFTTKSVR